MKFKDFILEADDSSARYFLKSVATKFAHGDDIRNIEDRNGRLVIDMRAYNLFTDRPGEEDDDQPRFTGGLALKKVIDSELDHWGLKGSEIRIDPSEKSWIEISIKPKIKKETKPMVQTQSSNIITKKKFHISDFSIGDRIKVNVSLFGRSGCSPSDERFANFIKTNLGLVRKKTKTSLIVDFDSPDYKQMSIWPSDVLSITKRQE